MAFRYRTPEGEQERAIRMFTEVMKQVFENKGFDPKTDEEWREIWLEMDTIDK